MPWLEQKDDGPFHAAFRFAGERYKTSLGTTDRREADTRLGRLEENIALVKQGRLILPEDADVAQFLLSDGKLDGKTIVKAKLRTLSQFRVAFLASIPRDSLEENTFKGLEIHLDHLCRILGKSCPLPALSLEDLQGYVDTRSLEPGHRGRNVSPTTMKKELATLRTLWNWAKHAGHLSSTIPSRGLRFPKTVEKPPFQTWTQITRKIEAYDLNPEQQADLWECLFLTTGEIDALLAQVEQSAEQPCIYPMFVFAAHTGARRSEILRSEVDDIDLFGRTITIREKKRVRGRITTRSVPISSRLFDVLKEWLDGHIGVGNTFTLDKIVPQTGKVRRSRKPFTVTEARDHFRRVLSKTKWSTIRGWHVFRHSFCSNCAAAGIDQRIINSWVGHQTEEMVKRYRHLIPNQQQVAIARVFDTAGPIPHINANYSPPPFDTAMQSRP